MHADGCAGQLALVAGAVVRLDFLDAALDFAHVLQVVAEARAVGRAQILLQPADRRAEPVEDAAVFGPALFAVGRRGAHAEQLIESVYAHE